MPQLTKHQQSVVDRIKELHAAGQPLNIDAIRKREPKLLAAAYKPKKFWGWLQALEAAGLTYADIRISLSAQGQCKVCKGWYGFLGRHLSTHGMTSEEYLDKYPGAQLVSEKRRASMTGSGFKCSDVAVKNWEPIYSKEFIADKIAYYHRNKYSLSCTEVMIYDFHLASAGRRILGRWDKALTLAGLNPEKIRLLPVPLVPYKTKGDVLHEIKRRVEEGLPITSSSVSSSRYEHDDKALMMRALFLFGSWRGAVESAGFDYNRISMKRVNPYKNKDAVKRALRKLDREGFPLRGARLMESPDIDKRSLHTAARKFFGSLYNAIGAAGLKPPKRGDPFKYPEKVDVLNEIKRRAREGLPLNASSICNKHPHCDPGLWLNGKRLFGSWTKAIEAAGIDTFQVCRRPVFYPDPESVLSALREYHRCGERMFTTNFLESDDPAMRCLYYAARRFFGGFVKAMEASGLVVPARPSVKYHDKTDILAEIGRREGEGLPLNADGVWNKPGSDSALVKAGRRMFGSWEAALGAAGLRAIDICRVNRTRYQDEDSVVQGLNSYCRRGIQLQGEVFVKSENRDKRDLYHGAIKQFGTFKKAVEAAGLEYDGRRRTIRYPQKKQVLAEIRRRARKGLPLNAISLSKPGKYMDTALYKSGLSLFGAWLVALETAGVSAQNIYRRNANRYQDKNSVLEGLKKYHDQGFQLAYNVFAKSDNLDQRSLCGFARKHFGSFRKAVEAAGFEYPAPKRK